MNPLRFVLVLSVHIRPRLLRASVGHSHKSVACCHWSRWAIRHRQREQFARPPGSTRRDRSHGSCWSDWCDRGHWPDRPPGSTWSKWADWSHWSCWSDWCDGCPWPDRPPGSTWSPGSNWGFRPGPRQHCRREPGAREPHNRKQQHGHRYECALQRHNGRFEHSYRFRCTPK